MDVTVARRAVSDVTSVCRTTSPTTAMRWVGALLVRLPECTRTRSLEPADRTWAQSGASFRTSSGAFVSLPAAYTGGAREMYCRNVYLRTGITIPSGSWVVDLGANCGLFSAWAAVAGARVIAVEAQHGFAPLIKKLAEHNGVAERVSIETAVASGVKTSGSRVGLISDDRQWAATSHGGPMRPTEVSIPDLIRKHRIDRIGLLKIDIEGGEFAVLATDEDLDWLQCVEQLVLEIHPTFGDATGLIKTLERQGFSVDLRDNFGRRQDADSKTLEYVYCQIT
jgi:FkbM family methyltransferase